jgi:putative ABC transport system permease protein
MHSILQDVRFAVRQLRRAPFFSLTVMLTLALSIGATAALTGILRATLLHPLPYPQSQRLVTIGDDNLRGFKSSGLVSIPRTQDLADIKLSGRTLFDSVGFYYLDESTLTIDQNTTVRVPAVAVNGTFFSTLGTPALLGRTLTPADDVPNGPQLVVLSYRLWQTKFAGDRSVIGRVVLLGTDHATIVGVMPRSFDLPSGNDLWHPGHVFASSFGAYRGDGGRFAEVIARFAPGQTIDTVRAATSQLAATLARAYPESDAAWGFKLTPLRDSIFGTYAQELLLLSAAVLLVLLVAAVNIAGLQLSRNAARAPEFAIRSALGITRARLTRQLLTESLLLVYTGAVAGIGLASTLLRLIASRLPATFVLVEEPHIDTTVLAVSLLAAFAVGLFTATLPALQARQQMSASSGRSLVGRTGVFGKTFATLQISLALVLLTLSVSVLQRLYSLLTTPLGFESDNLQTFTVDLPWGGKPEVNRQLYAQLEGTFAALPGVSSVGSMSALPFTPYSVLSNYDIAGQTPTPKHDAVGAEFRTFSLGYLHAMRIPLIAGRSFTAQDAEPNAPSVMLINQTLAKRYFAGRNPVGQQLVNYNFAGKPIYSEIVGVIGDVHGTGGSLNVPLQPEVYQPANGNWPHMQFVLRTSLPTAALEPQIRRIVSSSSSIASAGNLISLSTTIEHTLKQPRLNASLLSAFAALSMLLVMIGVYGLVAFDVARRTRELGLRIALGATRGGVIRLVLTEVGRVLLSGLGLGIAASLTISRLLAATFFGTSMDIGWLLATAASLLTLAVVVATIWPARSAANVDPMTVLRSE